MCKCPDLVFVVVQRLDTFFFLDIPELYQSIRRGRHELLAVRQKVDSEHRVGMSLKRLPSKSVSNMTDEDEDEE